MGRQPVPVNWGGSELRKLCKTFEAATQHYRVEERGSRVVVICEGQEFEFDRNGNYLDHRDKLAAFRIGNKKR